MNGEEKLFPAASLIVPGTACRNVALLRRLGNKEIQQAVVRRQNKLAAFPAAAPEQFDAIIIPEHAVAFPEGSGRPFDCGNTFRDAA